MALKSIKRHHDLEHVHVHTIVLHRAGTHPNGHRLVCTEYSIYTYCDCYRSTEYFVLAPSPPLPLFSAFVGFYRTQNEFPIFGHKIPVQVNGEQV